MFGVFGPSMKNISPTRKDTLFNLIPNLRKNKKRKEKKRETDARDWEMERDREGDNQPPATDPSTTPPASPTSIPIYPISSIYFFQSLMLIWFFFDALSPHHTFIVCTNMWLCLWVCFSETGNYICCK